MTAKRVTVGLSGGVDSAVAALLLQRAGYDVQAVFMKNWSEDDFGGPCPWIEDQASAQAVADHLRMRLQVWNFEREYRQRVFQVMLDEYAAGRTPNPDILCNREIKFDLFLHRALQDSALVATGHYARTSDGHLWKAVDQGKDQSYFLAGVPSSALRHVLFPLGEMRKSDVRAEAKAANLPNWDRPDSVGICFVGEKNMRQFLQRYLTLTPGDIIIPDGTRVGRHAGLPLYTIGQRHGFGGDLDQKKVAATVGAGRPLFIAAKDQAANTLTVAPAEQPDILTATEFLVEQPHWIDTGVSLPWSGQAKLRYRQDDISVTLTRDGSDWLVVCQAPQRAITPGQYAVFYQQEECLGSAVIRRVRG